MGLILDRTAAQRAVGDSDFSDWASTQTIFLSSVMSELADERKTVAAALEAAGFVVRWFEDFGGRDDPPDAAYLSEVAGADIYVGVLADDYGAMQRSGYSATHEEYNEARRRGKRVSFWVRSDGTGRQGHARDFLTEVRVFNTTGSFTTGEDLAKRLLRRLRELAAEDLSPWVKLGDVLFRATAITETSTELRIEARVRDAAVLAAIRAMAPDARFGRNQTVPATFGGRSGVGAIQDLAVRTTASSTNEVTIVLRVEWPSSRRWDAMSFNGIPHEDLVDAGLRVGVLGEPVPAAVSAHMPSTGTHSLGLSFLNTTDPLAELPGLAVPEGSVEAVAELLVVEHLVGGSLAAAVETFMLGPVISGRRRLQLGWREHAPYANQPAGHRLIEGDRPWVS